MKQIAKEKGVDLLLVDSGDLHDGTGLVDATDADGNTDASEVSYILLISILIFTHFYQSIMHFWQIPYDVMAIGKFVYTCATNLFVQINSLAFLSATNFISIM